MAMKLDVRYRPLYLNSATYSAIHFSTGGPMQLDSRSDRPSPQSEGVPSADRWAVGAVKRQSSKRGGDKDAVRINQFSFRLLKGFFFSGCSESRSLDPARQLTEGLSLHLDIKLRRKCDCM